MRDIVIGKMADRWLNEYIEKELNKPLVLSRLLEQGFDVYGVQDSNVVYKLKDELVLYCPQDDKILCSWSLEEVLDGLESE